MQFNLKVNILKGGQERILEFTGCWSKCVSNPTWVTQYSLYQTNGRYSISVEKQGDFKQQQWSYKGLIPLCAYTYTIMCLQSNHYWI